MPKKEPSKKNASARFLLFSIIIIILVAVAISYFNSKNQMELAPGKDYKEMLIADKKVNEAPSIVVPKQDSKSFGSIKTANGDFEVIGLSQWVHGTNI